VDRNRADFVGRVLLDPERHGGDELVLAVDDARVVPPAGEVGDLEGLLDVDLAATRWRGQHQQHEARKRAGEHPGIVDQNARTSTLLRISSRRAGSAAKIARSLPFTRIISVVPRWLCGVSLMCAPTSSH